MVERDGYVDPLTIKEYLQGKHISQKMFYATFEEYNERMAQLVGIEFDAVTLSRYRLCLRYFKEMMSRKTKVADFPIKHLNGEMIREFEAFLKIENRVAQNTMIRYMKCLKKVVNLAIANDWITANPFVSIKFSEKKVVKDFLTIEEVNTIRTKEFGIERFDMVRDIFIFCCYTGLAFIDVYNLKPEHITDDAHGRKWFHKQRQKTEVEFFVPLLEYSLQLIEKYRNHPMCRAKKIVFPVYANQKMNSYLKEIADFCGIKKAPYDAYSPLYFRHDNHAGEQCKIGECVKDAWSHEYSNDTPLRPHYERVSRPGDEPSGCNYGGGKLIRSNKKRTCCVI